MTRPTSGGRAAGPALGAAFDPRANGLTGIRLVLAASVIVWHSFPLTGRSVGFEPLRQVLGEWGVDGFFAISGFLITMSWVNRPRVTTYVRARALRILPGFWVCLLLTASVVAPLGMALSGAGTASLGDMVAYVVHGADLRIDDHRVGDSPLGIPYTEAWNGSLWTLFWEALCYVGVLVVGVLGWLRRPRLTTAVGFVVALALHLATVYGPVDHFAAESLGRFGLMFAAGALVWAFADVLPSGVGWVAAAFAVTLVATVLSDYRTVAALPMAYALIGVAALLDQPAWRPSHDISYGMYIYAFPAQQLLASAGLSTLPVILFMVSSAILTLPLAWASWLVVERPALRLKNVARYPVLRRSRSADG